VLKATVPGRVELVELASAALAEKTTRLPIKWPKKLRGERPLEVSAPDVDEPLRLLAKRAGGKATKKGLRLRLRPQDDGSRKRLERLASSEDEEPKRAEAAAPAPADEQPAAVDHGPATEAAAEQPPPDAEAPTSEPAPAADEEPAGEEEQVGASYGEVRTGQTLPPPSMPRRTAEQKRSTLKPPPAAKLPAAETDAAPTSDDAPSDEAEPPQERERAPEIEVHTTSSIPPELAEALEAEEAALAEGEEDESEPAEQPAEEAEAADAEPAADDAEEPTDGPPLDAAALLLLADESPADQQALIDAGTHGAMALCRARIGTAVDAAGRSRFFQCMRELGEAALPAIRATLGRALDDVARSGQPEALEDLLRAAPEVEDRELGRAVLPMCTHESPRVRNAAVAAMSRLYGELAKPALRDALRDDDDSVRRSAIDGLRRVGGIDMLALRRLEPILTATEDASEELRAVAAAALVDVDEGLRKAALDALHRALNPRSSMVSLFIKAEDQNPMLVEAICRTMLLIGGSKERRTVSKHASRSRPPLRQRLETLVRQHR
jgi:hypothetical protein